MMSCGVDNFGCGRLWEYSCAGYMGYPQVRHDVLSVDEWGVGVGWRVSLWT